MNRTSTIRVRPHSSAAWMCATGLLCIAASPAVAGTLVAQPAPGEPLLGLTAAQLARFQQGKNDFNHQFTPEEGVGPIFNKSSCGSCHSKPNGGPGSITVSRFGTTDRKGQYDDLDQFGGSLLQSQAIVVSLVAKDPFDLSDCSTPGNCLSCVEEIAASGLSTIEINRVTNGALAYGLVEAIPDSAIQAIARAQAGTGVISGKVHLVHPSEAPKTTRVGRFGWKAQDATVLTFSGGASLNELGITNYLNPTENDPNGILPPSLEQCDHVADPEDHTPDAQGRFFIDRITDFQRYLAAPPQTPKSGMIGEQIFMAIGCGTCHTPVIYTDNNPALEPAIRNKPVKAYSDWLLHDMGGLGDGIVQGTGTEREMKTPPLWGIAYRDAILHDGRVQDSSLFARVAGPEGAVYWHSLNGSEAQQSANAFMALSPASKQKVVDFLMSLGRREFDVTLETPFDAVINIADFYDFDNNRGFADCYGGRYSPDEPCAIHDVNQDGYVDDADFAVFSTVYLDPQGDCNGNRINDLLDILHGTVADLNKDGIPDSCQCLPDLNGSGAVNGVDLGMLLASWGPCGFGGCPADFNHSGNVNGLDLAIMLAAWGPCR